MGGKRERESGGGREPVDRKSGSGKGEATRPSLQDSKMEALTDNVKLIGGEGGVE